MLYKHTVRKIWNKYYPKWNCAASFQIYTFMYTLWAIYSIYSHDRSGYFAAKKIGGPILGNI